MNGVVAVWLSDIVDCLVVIGGRFLMRRMSEVMRHTTGKATYIPHCIMYIHGGFVCGGFVFGGFVCRGFVCGGFVFGGFVFGGFVCGGLVTLGSFSSFLFYYTHVFSCI